VQQETSVFRALTRHFRSRIFDSDFVGRGGSLIDSGITVATLLGAASVVLAASAVMRHWFMRPGTPAVVRSAMEWADRELLISISMTVVAVVAILCWQSMFPDRRDCLILSGLPLRTSTMIAAKLTALGTIFLAAVVAINWATLVLFPVAVMRYMSFGNALKFYLAHIVAIGAASAFVFILVLAIQALLASVLPFRWFQRSAAWIQMMGLFSVLLVFFLIPPISSFGALTLPENRQAALLLPPFWFMGLYAQLIGTQQHPFLNELAGMALRALGIVIAAAALLYGIAYRRLMRNTIEDSGAVGGGTAQPWKRVERAVERWLVNPRERATFYFIWRTMVRNRGHRLILAAYAAVGLVYIASGIAGVVKTSGGASLLSPNTALSALPLILPFFVLFGMRALFGFPVELQSNWIFRMTDAGRPDDYVRAARKVMLMVGILPVCVIGFPAYGLLWGWRIAAAHVLMSMFASMAMLEWMMAGFRKVPFTCPWMPGKGNLKVSFGAWTVLFLAVAYMGIQAELALARSPVGSIVGMTMAGAFWWYRVRKRRAEESPDVPVLWEEPPIWYMQTLELSK
jgi:hypothetical protein